MPEKDRREILKFLKKQAKDQRARFLSQSNKSKGVARSPRSKTTSDTSILSVNKDWEHWAILQGGSKAIEEDVCGIGDLIGVKYKCDNSNRFNVLSNEGRRELRAEVGRILSKGGVRWEWCCLLVVGGWCVCCGV